MKFTQITFGNDSATVYIYKFNLSEERITPRLYICNPTETKSLSSYINSLPSDIEPVIGINGGLFYTFNPLIRPRQIAVKDQVSYNTDGNVYDLMDLVFDNDNNLRIEKTDSTYVSNTNIKWIRSGAFNLIKDGSPVSFDTSSPNYSLYSETAERTAIGVDASFKKVTIVSTKTGSLSGAELQSVMMNYGDSVNAAVAMDGGHSTTLWANGEIKVNRYAGSLAERPISDAIIFTRSKTTEVSGYTLYAKNTPFRVREHVVSGNYGSNTVPIGGRATILQFIPGFQTDGYQWARVYYEPNNAYGYAQLDTSSDYIIERTPYASTIYLKANNIQFRIRPSVVNGIPFYTVPIGDKAQITAFKSGFESDGYQWVSTNYVDSDGLSHSGYSQLDLQNAYTIITG